MGYYTCFSLEVMTADNSAVHPEAAAIIAKLRETNEYANSALNEDGITEMDAKWYDYTDELREFSKLYPDAILVLYGDGENSDDFWCSYFRNGKVQCTPGRIEFDEFDETELT